MISKYPPIEGGVSSDNYWLARELGRRGHKIFFITNAFEIEQDYRMVINQKDKRYYQPKNVQVYSTYKDFFSPIPRSEYYSERLTDLAIRIIKDNEIDLIYSHYLLPYSYVGLVVQKLLSIRHVVRHAGSDLGRIYKSKFMKNTTHAIFENADTIFSGGLIYRVLEELPDEKKIYQVKTPLVNTAFFHDKVPPYNLKLLNISASSRVFAYFGKVSELKKTHNLLKAAAKIRDKDFVILMVSGSGKIAYRLKEFSIKIGLKDKCRFINFQGPWRIPMLMRAADCVVCPENDESKFLVGGAHYPKIAREAMACGKCVIIGDKVAEKGMYSKLKNNQDIICCNTDNIDQFSEILKQIVDTPKLSQNIGRQASKFSMMNENFVRDVDRIEKGFKKIVTN